MLLLRILQTILIFLRSLLVFRSLLVLIKPNESLVSESIAIEQSTSSDLSRYNQRPLVLRQSCPEVLRPLPPHLSRFSALTEELVEITHNKGPTTTTIHSARIFISVPFMSFVDCFNFCSLIYIDYFSGSMVCNVCAHLDERNFSKLFLVWVCRLPQSKLGCFDTHSIGRECPSLRTDVWCGCLLPLAFC